MSKKSKKEQNESGFEGIEHALTSTELFIENNSKLLSYIVLGIVVVILIIVGAKRFYIAPMENDAANEMFMAEKFFEKDSFNLALEGYGTYPGFLQIIDEYGITKSGKLAKYYAGICYLNMKDYDNAISYLEEFKTDDLLVGAAKYSSLGDAYSDKGDYEAAAKSYIHGADDFENEFSSPVLLKKAGLVYEEMGENNKALEIYKKISQKYPESPEGREMEKFIARVETKTAG